MTGGSNYSPATIVAHSLWEMTFHGFDEAEVSAQRRELQKRVDELDAMTEEEKKHKLIPLDQVLKEFKGGKKGRR